MKPPQPKLPKHSQTAQQHLDKLKDLVSGQCLETLVLERLELPEQVIEFNKFEELSKLYEIEQPFVPRTQIELLFDVYDGRRLQQGFFGSLDDGDDQNDQEPVVGELGRGFSGASSGGRGDSAAASAQVDDQQRQASWPADVTRKQSNFAATAAAYLRSTAKSGSGSGGVSSGLSWCKLLFERRQNHANRQPSNSGSPFKCCLKPSETNQDLGLVSLSTSGQSLAQRTAIDTSRASVVSNQLLGSVQAALAPNPDDAIEESELKHEALGLVSNALTTFTSRPIEAALMAAGEPSLGPALAMESAQMEWTGGSVSVCMIDKRGLARDGASLALTRSKPVNGRRWARASAKLIQLRRKLRNSSARSVLKLKCDSPSPLASNSSKTILAKKLNRIARKASRKFWTDLARDNLASISTTFCDESKDNDANFGLEHKSGSPTKWTTKRRKDAQSKFDCDQLIDLVKGSLNQLIDAQLLLRNKLTSSEQLSNSPIMNRIRGAEYENLLRNNFNLLKIWQNLEETKEGLVCFVCEPIKANLADLFWFNRRRVDWAQAQAFEATGLNSNTTLSNGGPSCQYPLFVSPLVCLDASQVKRGLLQILEALNFLHAICRLIHRNLTPKNILICHGDNWKLSGLEFAVRFESTLISESASMMAHEFSQARFASAQCALGGSSASSSPLRRQRSLHQTKCQEFGTTSRASSSLLLQPELDYLAPEIMRHAKCSHKSDMFSFGLILGQTYDLCRHKSQISCRSRVQNYETELKKLDERRKWKLARLVPLEMRQILIEMLDCEPNLRPSASYVLQLLKRPLELCKSNEDSLRHLRSSLDYLESRFSQQTAVNQTGGYGSGGQHELGNATGQSGGKNLASSSGAVAKRARAANYFRRVTSAAANQAPTRRQTRTLQLLNYFVRALDAVALTTNQNNTTAGAGQRAQCLPSGGGVLELQLQQQQGAGRRPSFSSMRLQFEQTLETLRQVLKSSAASGEPLPGATACSEPSGRRSSTLVGGLPVDSRSLLLLVALHRRLLEQVGQLRQELPPICRLIAPSSAGSSQPLDRSLSSASHRALADLEERLCLTISQQSIGRLAESLTDPLLKLEEFLLVFELVSDLVSFLGQKCKQNYCLRGKQLLNELTPVTGCPSLSSSEEDDDDDQNEALTFGVDPNDNQDERAFGEGFNRIGGHSFSGSTLALAMQANAAVNGPIGSSGGQNQVKRASQQSYHQQQDRPLSRQQLYNLPTSINVTAPSPMGSTRDVSRQQLAGSPEEPQLFSTIGNGGSTGRVTVGPPMKRHSHQDVLNCADQLIGKTSQMSLGPSPCSSRRSIASCVPADEPGQRVRPRHCDSSDNILTTTTKMMNKGIKSNPTTASSGIEFVAPALQIQTGCGQQGINNNNDEDDDDDDGPQDDESRSKLIDELLKTINDDSFNEFIDFNNKLSAATKTAGSTSSQPDQMNSAGDQLSDLVNASRPKSALGGDGATRHSASGGQSATSGSSQARPPRTLNLNPSGVGGATGSSTNKSSGGASGRPVGQRARGSICVTSSNQQQQQPSTFDNVIRRMSTNFVQNFNKMSAGTLGASTNDALGGGCGGGGGSGSSSTNSADLNTGALRREKSSNAAATTYSNSLYVDNQIPARRHSDNTINVPRIQVALSSPSSSGSRTNLNQRASVSASKLATKWKLTAKSNQREASDKLSPNLGGALGYIRRHSSGNTQGGNDKGSSGGSSSGSGQHSGHDQNQSNGLGAQLLNASPFKTRSNSNLGMDFLMSNRSMKRRYSAASMLGHQTQRKAENLIDAGMKSVQNMFS